MVTNKRNRLTNETMRALMCMKHWIHYSRKGQQMENLEPGNILPVGGDMDSLNYS